MSSKDNYRELTVKLKTARKRSNSSARWLQRQLNDPYVQQAKRDGYRSRAAYKLLDLNEKFKFLRQGQKILDLGAAPGGWTQIALEKGCNDILGVDLLPVEPIQGVTFLELDFLSQEAPDIIIEQLKGKADVVMSDMAANTTGHKSTDHIRIISLCENAYYFAKEVLNQDGAFICKVLRGGTENALLKILKKDFKSVKHAKPESSRKDSAESYLVAQGFRG